MSRFFEIGLGLRYARSVRRDRFASFVAASSATGIAIGVAALIIVLSVMNGFQNELKSKILSATPHVQVRGAKGDLPDWRERSDNLSRIRGVVAAAPFVSAQVLLASNGSTRGAVVSGVVPGMEEMVSPATISTLCPLSSLEDGRFRIILGEKLASVLGVEAGDRIRVVSANVSMTLLGGVPRTKTTEVACVLRTGIPELDRGTALMSMSDAGLIFGTRDAASGIRLRLADPMEAPLVKELASKEMEGVSVSSWADVHASLFRALRMEKTMMFVILSLVVGVAAFNLISGLVMAVSDKKVDVAVLRTMGARPSSIAAIFFVQGTVISASGVIIGCLFGIMTAANLDVILPLVERVLGVSFPSDAYMSTADFPSDMRFSDVAAVCGMSLALSFASSIYPAVTAARTEAAEALRYE